MKKLFGFILASLITAAGCGGSFGSASKYFTGPVTGVGLKPTTSIVSQQSEQLAAMVAPSKTANKNVVWESSDTSVATVDSTGLVSAVGVVAHGQTKSATITVTTEEGGFTATCVVTVVEKPVPVTGVTLNKTSSFLVVASPGTEQLTAAIAPTDATNQTLAWTSDAPAIVDVDSTGLVTAKQAGSGTITATASNGVSASCSFTVSATPVPATGIALNKASTVIAAGKSETLFTIFTPLNTTNQNVIWTSSAPGVATVDLTGLVRGAAASATPVTITSTTTDGSNLSVSASVTVVATAVAATGVSLAQSSATVTIGKQMQMTAAIVPAGATDQNLRWSSDAPAKASVDSSGVVTGIAEGVATVTVKTEDGGYAKSCVVNVTGLPTYSVTYDGNSASGTAPEDHTSYLEGSTVIVRANTGFVNGTMIFNGWSDGTKSYQPGSMLTMGNTDVTLYAQWTAAAVGNTVSYAENFPSDVVTADTSGSVPVSSSAYLAGTTVAVLGNSGSLKAKGYVFAGWNSGTTTYQPGQSFVMGSTNVTLSAVWTRVYSVTYTKGSTGTPSDTVPVDSAAYLTGSAVTVMANTLINDGYSFGGWEKDGTTFQPGQTFEIGNFNVALTAQWTANPTYTVTYYDSLNSSTPVYTDSIQYKEGATVIVSRPAAYICTGLGFSGWMKGSTLCVPGSTFIMPAADVGLYAKRVSSSVYVCGGGTTNQLWVNDIGYPLDSGGWSSLPTADSIFVSGDDLFIAGRQYSGAYTEPVYYKNNVAIRLPWVQISASGAHYYDRMSICADGSDLYIGGSKGNWSAKYQTALYWKTLTTAITGTGVAEVILYCNDANDTQTVHSTSVYVSEADVYYSGYYLDFACYWKVVKETGVLSRADLSGTSASKIILSDNHVYVAGVCDGGKPCYWKDGTRYILNATASSLSIANGIAVASGKVHIVGTDATGTARHWVYDSTTNAYISDETLSGGTVANAITISSAGDIYIAGTSGTNAMYWKNGTQKILPGGSHANSIFVK